MDIVLDHLPPNPTSLIGLKDLKMYASMIKDHIIDKEPPTLSTRSW
jgi:hypothetical protein